MTEPRFVVVICVEGEVSSIHLHAVVKPQPESRLSGSRPVTEIAQARKRRRP